jgi:uncharacterized secreted protein with C-terminal beta-propeller domain
MIIDVSEPDTPKLTSRVPLFGQPVEMYIVEPRAYVILTHYYNAFLWAEDGDTEPEYRHGSEIVVIDITNPADPEVQQYIELSGFITNTRRVGEVIYAVANNYDSYGYYGLEGIDMGVGIKAEAGSSTTREGTVDAEEDDPDGGDEVVPTEPEPEPREEEKKESGYDEEEEYFSEEFAPKEGTVVVSINLENLDNIVEVDRETFLGTSNEIHVTENAIFIAQPEYNYYSDPIFGHMEQYYTRITYVDISDYHGDIKLRDTFTVDGYLEDRYQMDYFEGTFRIVTHFWGEWDKLGESKLWIFDTQNPDDINKKGELLIDDAGSLMATRFAGERAYTIHLPYSVDPLDVIDLSNPSKPVLTDILEMPGWVTHMEVRGFKILALGVDDSEGKQKVAVSLFDVSDPYEAVMEDRVIIGGDGYSWSTANWDPKALSVIDDQNLILVPFQSYSYDQYGNSNSFSGLQLVQFDLEEGDLVAGGAIEQMGTVERTRATSERIFALSYKQLQVIDANNLEKPKITAILELCNNIIDIIPMGDYCVQVISEYDYNKGITVTKLRTVDAATPDTSIFLAEKSVELGTIKYYRNGGYLYLVCTKYFSETYEVEGWILVYDYSNPTKPKLSSEFKMDYYEGNNYWGYYDMYYYGWYSNPRSSATDYNFALVDDDLLAYHPSPDWNNYYYEKDVVYDEENGVDGSVETETKQREEENVTEPPKEPEEPSTKPEPEPEPKEDWDTVDEKIYFIDLSDPANPKDVGNLTLENTSRITGLYANGKTLFIIQYQDKSGYDDNSRWQYVIKYYLLKVDLSDPTNPKQTGPINIPGGFLGLNSEGTVLYTRTSLYDENYNFHQTLNVLTLSDDKATLASAIDLGDDYPDIFIQDTTIIITYHMDYYWYFDDVMLEGDASSLFAPAEQKEQAIKTKIQVIDAQDPKNLKLLTTIGLKNYGGVYNYENNKLYIQLSDVSGILIYKLESSRSPDFLGYYPTHGWVASIREDTKTGKIYLACGQYGVLLIEV